MPALGSLRLEPLPADTEARMSGFADTKLRVTFSKQPGRMLSGMTGDKSVDARAGHYRRMPILINISHADRPHAAHEPSATGRQKL
jgi:hypothetical protein